MYYMKICDCFHWIYWYSLGFLLYRGLKRQHWVQVLIKTTSELSSKFLSSLDASVLIFNMLEYPLSSIILTCAHFMKLHLPFSLSIKLITTFLGMLNSETNAQLLYFLVNLSHPIVLCLVRSAHSLFWCLQAYGYNICTKYLASSFPVFPTFTSLFMALIDASIEINTAFDWGHLLASFWL